MSAREQIQMGTVIRGTLRRQDLIPELISVLRNVDADAYVALMTSAVPPVPSYVWDEGDDSSWWGSGDAGWVLEQLIDKINAAAPPGHYFGAHPGDDSDVGFWPIANAGIEEIGMRDNNRTVAALQQAMRFLEGKAAEAQVSGLVEQSYHYSEASREIGRAVEKYRSEVLNES